ncbi:MULTISPECIES: hypothetical protein [Acinetobacter]|uniref:hypothetical protein n=1 Tax=Acinetobacter TaxID=469 RepID=UPI000EA38970|nr:MULTISPECIES: hypothetical protein [Acinetobacter]RKG43832.1 hypothetical protein D7V51_09220 [Acinetobacter cumulans]RZG59547.1 hypothetical protein EXE29_08040 [Acinetobacter sp. WCHAc060006]
MSEQLRDPNLSWVYQELTKDDNGNFNLVNNIAYILYKQRKIEFYQSHNGHPTIEQLRTFQESYMLAGVIKGLRDESASIVQDILKASLANKVREVEIRLTTTLEAEMKTELATLKTELSGNHTQLKTLLETATQIRGSNHSSLIGKLDGLSSRGWKWWCAEIGKGALITIASTILLWLIFVAVTSGKEKQAKFQDNHLPEKPERKTTKPP